MLGKTRAFLDLVRSSLWFWPLLLNAGAFALAKGMIALDQSGWVDKHPDLANLYAAVAINGLFGAGADGARTLLATIAGSMISIAATVFSITIVVLSLAAGQMGPRLLRTFMRDRGTQISLGTFVATFSFSVIVLGVVNGDSAEPFVPKMSISAALALALLSLGVLIFFIHHVARSIQVSEVIAVVGSELEEAVDRLFPEEIGTAFAPEDFEMPPALAADAGRVAAAKSGYIQEIDGQELIGIASSRGLVIEVSRRPGDHVIAGTTIARFWPASAASEQLCDSIGDKWLLGRMRTPAQNALVLVDQLVEIALRALSPGVNDPISAEACVDQLGITLAKLMDRRMPPRYRRDESGQLRIVTARPDTFMSFAHAALDPLRDAGSASLRVLLRLAQLIADLAELSRSEEQRDVLREQAMMILRAAGSLSEARDRESVEFQCQAALKALRVAQLQ